VSDTRVHDLVLVDDADGVRTITLNRPEARNAFNTHLYRATGSALDGADADDGVRVVILTGAGKGFSAGQDLKEMAQVGRPDERDPDVDVPDRTGVEEHGFRTFIDAIEGFSKPLIAAVHGAAVGIGTTMLPYCDFVIVADDARLRLPFVPLGVVPEAGSSFTIPAIVGRQQASSLLLLGEWLDGPGAVAVGLALKCVPRDDLGSEAQSLARRLAASSATSLAATKRLIRAGWLDAARAARTREEEVFATLLGHGDSVAALEQFTSGGHYDPPQRAQSLEA
jgi:enoyl-CoA hydratase/carnithine racemase